MTDAPERIWADDAGGWWRLESDENPGALIEYVRADLHDALRALVAELEAALRGLLEPFDDDPCRYDHHGYCQQHFVEPGDRCCVKLAREALDAADIRAMKGGGE